jgi:hypothetical protein
MTRDKCPAAATINVTDRDDNSLAGERIIVTRPRMRYGFWAEVDNHPSRPQTEIIGMNPDGTPAVRTIEPTPVSDMRRWVRGFGRRARHEDRCPGCGEWFRERPAWAQPHCRPCAACGVLVRGLGRQRYCSQACRQRAYRRRRPPRSDGGLSG